jgi:hypothetical protein
MQITRTNSSRRVTLLGPIASSKVLHQWHYLDSPYFFKISAALDGFPAPPPADPELLAPLVEFCGLIENPRLMVRAMELNPLDVEFEAADAVPIPSGDPFAALPVPVPVPLLLSLWLGEKEPSEGGLATVRPWDPEEKLPDPVEEVIAMAGADLPPGIPIGKPREWAECDEATDAGRPTDEGAKSGVSRDLGDRVDRDDLRYWLALIVGAMGIDWVVELSGTGDSDGGSESAVSVLVDEGGAGGSEAVDSVLADEGGGTVVSSGLMGTVEVMTSELTGMMASSDICSITAGMIGGK